MYQWNIALKYVIQKGEGGGEGGFYSIIIELLSNNTENCFLF